MRKLIHAAAAAAFVVSGLAVAGEKLHIHGKPENYEGGKAASFAVWHEDGKWHLRTTTAKKEHHFKGTITVKGGKVTELHGVKTEKRGDKKDRFVLGPEKHRIAFEFQTDEGEDGIDFDVTKEADSIVWDLEIGGEKGIAKHDKARVFVGKKGQHPDELPFETKAHPGKD